MSKPRYALRVLTAAALFAAVLAPGQASAQNRDPSEVSCLGIPATIFSNAAVIDGTPGHDVIVAGNANNTIRGLGGNDRICSGLGNDVIDGGTGNDRIHGGAGNDDLMGGLGHDVVIGGDGDDFILGDDGTQFDEPLASIYHPGGNDYLFGGNGNDYVGGEGGNDFLRGNEGNDVVDGFWGVDRVEGNPGNDLVSGGVGKDVVTGGIGENDLCWPELVVLSAGVTPRINPGDLVRACEQINTVLN